MDLNDRKIKSLPQWAKYKKDRDGEYKIFVKPSIVYPIYITDMGLQNDQYGAEVARRCMIEDIFAIAGTGTTIRIERDDAWKLSALPEGLGAQAGALQFRRHYNQLLRDREAAAK